MSDLKNQPSPFRIFFDWWQTLFGKKQPGNQNYPGEFKDNELLLKQVIRIAQHESELELGVNPSDIEQAQTSYLTEADFEYISRICVIVERKLKDQEWLTKTIAELEGTAIRKIPIRGIRFDDELFKAGRGILESFILENYHHKEK